MIRWAPRKKVYETVAEIQEDLPGRPVCNCQTDGIGPHWHDPDRYHCPMQAVPIRKTEPVVTEEVAANLQLHDLDDVLEEAGIDPDEIAAIDAAMCGHGNSGYCDACTEAPAVFLDVSDPFEAVLMDIVSMNRRKRRDYALDGSPFSNFDTSSAAMGLDGFGSVEAAVFNVNQKLARLRSLRANGRLDDPANEAVTDTYLDLAVYAVIALAIHVYPDGKVPWIQAA